MEETLVSRVLKTLKERRENVLRGEINCIPSPFTRFRSEFAGIEQGRYYLVSGITINLNIFILLLKQFVFTVEENTN